MEAHPDETPFEVFSDIARELYEGIGSGGDEKLEKALDDAIGRYFDVA